MLARFLLAYLTLPISVAIAQLPNPHPEPRPNFVFIAVDDLNHYASFLADQPDNFLNQIYPDPAVRDAVTRRMTPNLQRLADQSLIFRRAYSASPLCGPSRASLFTGVPAHVSGYYDHNQGHFRDLPSLKDVVTLPQFLKQNGYFTTGLGKLYHRGETRVVEGHREDWPDMAHSWSKWIERRQGIGGPDGLPWTFSPYSEQEGYFRWGLSETPLRRSWDYLNADFAAELLENGHATITDRDQVEQSVTLPADQPFFLGVGIFTPHMPWFVPQEYLDLFPVDEMTGIDATLIGLMNYDAQDIPEGVAQEFMSLGGMEDFDTIIANGERVDGPGIQSTINAWRSALQAYLATTAFADRCVGRLLDGIEASSAYENTVVVLWGDHGWHLGEKRRFRKHALWDGANHTVMLIRDPARKHASRGDTTEHLVSLQDLYPTLVERAGLERPEHVHGRSLLPLLDSPELPNWNDEILMTYWEGNHAVRTPDHYYIRYRDAETELYDLQQDPLQIENLSEDPRHRDLRTQLDETLNDLLAH
ncbi:MAG: sulfatase [Synoicihabitans sp.]